MTPSPGASTGPVPDGRTPVPPSGPATAVAVPEIPGRSETPAPPQPPQQPSTWTMVIHISGNSDSYAASSGLGVTIAGTDRGRCTGAGSDCPYVVRDGDSVRLSLRPEFEVYSWGSGPCASAPVDGPCVFTARADVGFNVTVHYVPG